MPAISPAPNSTVTFNASVIHKLISQLETIKLTIGRNRYLTIGGRMKILGTLKDVENELCDAIQTTLFS